MNTEKAITYTLEVIAGLYDDGADFSQSYIGTMDGYGINSKEWSAIHSTETIRIWLAATENIVNGIIRNKELFKLFNEHKYKPLEDSKSSNKIFAVCTQVLYVGCSLATDYSIMEIDKAGRCSVIPSEKDRIEETKSIARAALLIENAFIHGETSSDDELLVIYANIEESLNASQFDNLKEKLKFSDGPSEDEKIQIIKNLKNNNVEEELINLWKSIDEGHHSNSSLHHASDSRKDKSLHCTRIMIAGGVASVFKQLAYIIDKATKSAYK